MENKKLKDTPFTFLLSLFNCKPDENNTLKSLNINACNNQSNNLLRRNSYEHIKDLKIKKFGNFKIVQVLDKRLFSIICLCEWIIDNSKKLYLPNYVKYINKDIFNENIKIENDVLNDTNQEKSENINNLNKKYKYSIVLKLKHKGSYYSEDDIKELRREIEIHKDLNHINILKMLLYGEDENDLWVFTEYSSLGDLYTYTKFKVFKEIEVKLIIIQILYAFYYLHTNGIIHCDAKLENILMFPFKRSFFEKNISNINNQNNSFENIKLNLDKIFSQINENISNENISNENISNENISNEYMSNEYISNEFITNEFMSNEFISNENISYVNNSNENIFKTAIKLCDFGLSVKCDIDKYYPNRGVIGSYGYIAPEIFKDLDFNHKIDMWALGIMTFILLGGYRPFYPYTHFEETVNFHERYWSEIPSEAKHFIQSLLQINPDKRLSIIEAIKHPWVNNYFIIYNKI